MVEFDAEKRVGQVLAVKAELERRKTAYEESIAPLQAFKTQAEAQLLQYLNKTKQKSAATARGTFFWNYKVSYRIEDKDTFSRHVIGAQAWELVSWHANPTACETFAEVNNKEPPPGLVRDAFRVLHINRPRKPRSRRTVSEPAGVQAEEPQTEEPQVEEPQVEEPQMEEPETVE